ncbi:polysaccharide deacetylase family protein [Humitalea sp. 24SJ18S-53]|uniref:polysaccharide deacetylase family protein n=1 Tax=Humitalea sp. 24SJ18S-53 TaxID=3422307 RepID=UPI003D67DD06
MITVMYETWPDGMAPPYSPMASALRDGVIDRQGISWAEYGGKTGIWRLKRLFDAHGVKGTVAANAQAVERYPDSIRALHDAGHEIAGHSYTQNMFMPYLAPDAEQALIKDCSDIIAAATGERPSGWASPRMTPTEHTAGFLAEAGMVWHGDYNDTDLPYVVNTSAGPIVALQHSDFTDNRVMRGAPRDFWDVYRDTFDFLIASDRPEILNLTVHAHFGGRPPMAAVVDRILRHMRAADGVWFARHDEVARWVLEQPHGVG